MKYIKDFENKFIDESYLLSNYSPLYHLTDVYFLDSIIDDNCLKVGWVDNHFFGKSMKIISLTRNPKMNLSHYKDFDVIIELDKNELIKNGYKIYPYDFFIQSKKEDLPKSNKDRKSPFEFEEAITKDVSNISKYIISVNFLGNSIFEIPSLSKKIKEKNIKVYKNGK
jgi:hypothetical protein